MRFAFARLFGKRRFQPADEALHYVRLKDRSDGEWRAALAESPATAARWVYAAARDGSTAAQVAFGQMLLDGRGIARDPQAALRWFRIAADAGDLDAVNMVGRCHELGFGVAADPAAAARWYRRAAESAHGWAAFNLAMLTLEGNGVPRDPRAALSLLVRAARRRNAKAMSMIGQCREDGVTGAPNLRSAIRWYRRAAQGGCFRGAFHTGRFLVEAGRPAEAARWLAAAVEAAPAAFCREAAPLLIERPEPEIRAAGLRALERAAQSEAPADLYAYGCALVQAGRLEDAAAVLAKADACGYPGASAQLRATLDRLSRERNAAVSPAG